MQDFLELITQWPTAVYTVLLGVVLIYWLLALLGAVDLDSGGLHFGGHHGIHHDAIGHGEGGHLSTIASYAVAFGLNGVPFSIIVSLLTLTAWVITGLISQYALIWVPTAPLRTVAGLGVAVFAMVASIMVTAVLVKPMRGLFVRHVARSNQSLVGLQCRITTLTVSETFGQAEASDSTGSFNVRIRAAEPNTLTKGSYALIIDYDESSQRYHVAAVDPVLP